MPSNKQFADHCLLGHSRCPYESKHCLVLLLRLRIVGKYDSLGVRKTILYYSQVTLGIIIWKKYDMLKIKVSLRKPTRLTSEWSTLGKKGKQTNKKELELVTESILIFDQCVMFGIWARFGGFFSLKQLFLTHCIDPWSLRCIYSKKLFKIHRTNRLSQYLTTRICALCECIMFCAWHSSYLRTRDAISNCIGSDWLSLLLALAHAPSFRTTLPCGILESEGSIPSWMKTKKEGEKGKGE